MNLKSNIKIENCVLHYNGKEIPLMSGEFHYWRVLAENWEIIAEKIKEMGFNAIATYIPWNYHELEPEVYDFYGNTSPQRNLDKFLTLMKKAGLYVIIRPGPYIYSEWPFGGVPERCSKFHRLSTEFLAMSKHYINAVSTIIRPHQITYGGSIIICQADGSGNLDAIDDEAHRQVWSLGNFGGGFMVKAYQQPESVGMTAAQAERQYQAFKKLEEYPLIQYLNPDYSPNSTSGI